MKVTLKYVVKGEITVEASNEAEARLIALEKIEDVFDEDVIIEERD